MSKRPIMIVTGGAGFIGSHMVELLLAKGNCVRAIDNLIDGSEANLVHLIDNPNLTLDQRDIRALAWQPEISFEEGISHALEQIDYWKEAPLWNPETIATANKAWFEYLS